jgi:hypothetical protein
MTKGRPGAGGLSAGKPRKQSTVAHAAAVASDFRHSDLAFDSSFGVRISSFGSPEKTKHSEIPLSLRSLGMTICSNPQWNLS